MSKMDEFFALTKLCRKLNLDSSANTNSTYITDNLIEKTLIEGPTNLLISLDSHLSKVHDYIRGKEGTFDHVVSTIQSLVKLKKKSAHIKTRIVTSTIIFNDNIGLWRDYILFAKNLGVDGMLFQIIDKTFWNQAPNDLFFEKNFFKDKERAKNKIDQIIEEFGNDPAIYTKPQDLRWMKLYIDNPNYISEQVCDSHKRNMMIDMNGNVSLCFYMHYLTSGKHIGNIREHRIKDLWRSQYAGQTRNVMKTCRLHCGMQNCHRKELN